MKAYIGCPVGRVLSLFISILIIRSSNSSRHLTMNDVFSNSAFSDKPILGRMSGDTTTALLSSRFSREQQHIAPLVSLSASIAKISQQIKRKRHWQDQFKTIVQLARAGTSNGRGLGNPMYAFERALMDLWALYDQCIAFRLPTLEMVIIFCSDACPAPAVGNLLMTSFYGFRYTYSAWTNMSKMRVQPRCNTCLVISGRC